MRAKAEQKKAFSDIYGQQNVYIDKRLIKSVDLILKQSGRKKKDIYNEALKMYLDIVYGKKVDLS